MSDRFTIVFAGDICGLTFNPVAEHGTRFGRVVGTSVGDALENEQKLAAFMTRNGFATGHGDTFADLLVEFEWQIEELRARARAKTKLPLCWGCEGNPSDENDPCDVCGLSSREALVTPAPEQS